MKTCPVCAARSFDDAEVCYGCLYRLSQNPPEPHQIQEAQNEEAVAVFEVSLLAARDRAGAVMWTCRVDPVISHAYA